MSETDNTQTSVQASAPARAPERFETGFVVGQRYRIVTAIGRGGMGEVYRATDLLLGHDVALKFLPPGLSRDPQAVERFRNEVRVARQVTHPNVCRVHDLGEHNGQPFLSMELIAGEDLARLLRRIGRLPEDKAYAIAGQIAAGLAAAHAKGLIHRDLKPANVMIDADGSAVVTDFGLAAVAGEVRDVQSGTILYQAPEQRSGEGVSARSDIYSLGLIIAEMLTGVRPDGGPISNRSMRAEVVELIERCLTREPEKRPSSALTVARALPGSDPLAQALAAGRTPSPEAVENAQNMPVLQPAIAIGLFVCILGAVAAPIWLKNVLPGFQLLTTEPPDVLRYKARAIAAKYRPDINRRYEASGIETDSDYAAEVRGDKRMSTVEAFLRERRPVLVFWYRAQNEPFTSDAHPDMFRVSGSSPPIPRPGGLLVLLDGSGNVVRLDANTAEETRSSRPFDWTGMLGESIWRGRELRQAQPAGVPTLPSDQRDAWTTTTPSGRMVRIEAEAFRGLPTHFRSRAETPGPSARPPDQQFFILFFGMAAVASLVGVLQFRAGRADLVGAVRSAALIAMIDYVATMLQLSEPLHWSAESNPLAWCLPAAQAGLLIFVYFMAMEPLVRRYWPDLLVGWTRLVRGNPRDAFVATNVLAGLAAGVVFHVIWRLSQARYFTPDPLPPVVSSFPQAISILLLVAFGGVFFPPIVVIALAILRALVRSRVRAMIGAAILGCGMLLFLNAQFEIGIPLVSFIMGFCSVLMWIVCRYGLLGCATFISSIALMDVVFVHANLDWAASYYALFATALIGLASWALYRILAHGGFWPGNTASSLRT